MNWRKKKLHLCPLEAVTYNDVDVTIKCATLYVDHCFKASSDDYVCNQCLSKRQQMMETFYHGSSSLFKEFDLSHILEGDGKVKFGYGVYVTSQYRSAAHYAGANPVAKKFYVYTVGETIVLTIFLIILFSLMSSQSYIYRNKKSVSSMTAFIHNLKIELFTYASTIDDPTAKKIVDDLVSIVKYSDPVSCDETKQIEEEIMLCFHMMKESKGGDISSLAEKVKQLLSVRNKICQQYK